MKISFFIFLFFLIFFGCSNKSYVPVLSKEEKNAIDSLEIDSILVLEVKVATKVEFNKMPGAVQVLQAVKKNQIYPLHGIQVGFFEVSMEFDEPPLKKINEKWNSKGYGIYTVKGDRTNRLMIKLL